MGKYPGFQNFISTELEEITAYNRMMQAKSVGERGFWGERTVTATVNRCDTLIITGLQMKPISKPTYYSFKPALLQ